MLENAFLGLWNLRFWTITGPAGQWNKKLRSNPGMIDLINIMLFSGFSCTCVMSIKVFPFLVSCLHSLKNLYLNLSLARLMVPPNMAGDGIGMLTSFLSSFWPVVSSMNFPNPGCFWGGESKIGFMIRIMRILWCPKKWWSENGLFCHDNHVLCGPRRRTQRILSGRSERKDKLGLCAG